MCLNKDRRLAVKAEMRKMSAYTVIYKTRDGRVLLRSLGNEKKFSDAAKHAEKLIIRNETTILALCRDEDAASLVKHFNGQCRSTSPGRSKPAQNEVRERPVTPSSPSPLRGVRPRS